MLSGSSEGQIALECAEMEVEHKCELIGYKAGRSNDIQN